MKKIKQLVALILLSLVFLYLVPLVGNAERIAGNGGGVQTTGEISFYEETKSTTEPSTSASTKKMLPSTKPGGRFPSTGDLVKKSFLIVGSTLAVVAILFLFLKRKKKEGTEKEGR